jgi:RHH-type proline utilization regulon transcriptional repressor/proline dehydrogenase/delta 1-pyrroline-5-carboxylate dehydrogenase
MVAQSSAIPTGPSLQELREQIRSATLQDEVTCVKALLKSSSFSLDARARAKARAAALVTGARRRARERPLLDSFLQEFALSNEEGVALMCLAEGLLRIPDDETADRLIADKIASGNWSAHAGQSDSLWVTPGA